jgi:hypothetical protein
MPKVESSASSNAATPSDPVDTSEKVRYEKLPLRVSVEDESPARLTSEQKYASKKLYSPHVGIPNIDSWQWIDWI